LDLPSETVVDVIAALANPDAARIRVQHDRNFVMQADEEILGCFVRLLLLLDDPVDKSLLAPLVVKEIVVRLLRSGAGPALTQAGSLSRLATRIQASMSFIQAGCCAKLTLSELATEASMSPSHYAHAFKEIAGVSPMRYLRDVRLQRARELLLSSGVPQVREVAFGVGFESPEHFSREFKRRFDLSPLEYARKFRSAHSMDDQ
jgi:transcriptional regulator GlxA family with amidase domain